MMFLNSSSSMQTQPADDNLSPAYLYFGYMYTASASLNFNISVFCFSIIEILQRFCINNRQNFCECLCSI